MLKIIASIAVLSTLPVSTVAAPATEEPPASGLYVHVEGMRSDVCEAHLENTLIANLEDVADARADHDTGWVWVEVEEDPASAEAIREVIEATCSFTVTEVRRDPPPLGEEESAAEATDGP